MPKVETEITIAASCTSVWKLLLDFRSYPSWNPYIISLEGVPTVGSRLKARFHLTPLPPVTIEPTVVYNTPERYFSWRGAILGSLLLTGEHYFELQPLTPQRCLLRHGERFIGLTNTLLGPPSAKLIGIGIRRMNEALKTQVETKQGITQAATATPTAAASRH